MMGGVAQLDNTYLGRLRRQIETIARAARAAGLSFGRELPQDFESRIVQRLRP